MGMFGGAPKAQPIVAADISPKPDRVEPDPVDPASLDQARTRAAEGERRKNRGKMQIALGGTGGGASGLQIA